jgi:Pleckstrin homology domain
MAPQEEEEEDARSVVLFNYYSPLDAQNVGYARRYFYLRASGTLSYSLQPGQPNRDQILLHNAALSSSPSNRYIHVDTERSTFHMRGMTQIAYENWMTALRSVSFIQCVDPL